jgi:multidrug efflux system outer membrane protein
MQQSEQGAGEPMLGRLGRLNALDADRDLFDAELGLPQTRRNELLVLVQLYRALGGGWQQ